MIPMCKMKRTLVLLCFSGDFVVVDLTFGLQRSLNNG